MRKIFAPFIVLGCMFAVVACSNGGGSSAPTPVCPLTHVYDAATNTCKPVTPGPVPPSGNPNVPAVAEYYDYNIYIVSNGRWPTVYNGDMQIVNQEAYKTFLKEAMGVCDRNIWGGNYGLHDCNTWLGGSFIIAWRMDSTMVPVVQFTAQPPQNSFNWAFSWGFDGGGAALNPLTLPMHSHQQTTFNLINNSAGYEIRANGSPWNGGGLRLMQIQVHQGTLADNEVVYEFYYPHNHQPTLIAKGKFKRYQ